MTEVEYVLDNFDRQFAALRERKILLHGSRNYAEAILRRFGKEYNFVGVMSMDPLEGESWNGLPILQEEDLYGGLVDLVILTERVKYAEAAFNAIRRGCRRNGIEIRNMYGLDEFQIHREAGKATMLDPDKTLLSCIPYDIVSFEVMDNLLAWNVVQGSWSPRKIFSELIPKLRAMGKALRFSLRRSFPEDEQIRALERFDFLKEERELIRRSGEDLSFRLLKESNPGKRILYFGNSSLANEYILPRCYGIDCIRFIGQTLMDFDCLIPDCTAPERESYFPEWRDEILDRIRRHSIISFDVFDTLLMRKTLYPRDVFELTEQKAKKAGYMAEGFAAARSQTEDSLPYCKLEEIYEDLADLYAWDSETEEAVKCLELNIERSVLVPRPALVELMMFALKEGKRVVLTSDMYLPEPVIQEMLEEKGVQGYEKILVSCDYGKSKHTGLYEILMEYAGAASILHIGDNPESDGTAPKALGIDSVIIPSALSMARRSSWFDAVSCASSLNERCLLGMVLCSLFADPFRNPNLWELSAKERMTCMGICVIGPMIVGHTSWLIRELKADNYDGVLFLARDGWLQHRLYERIRGDMCLPPSWYFQANRHSAFLCDADEILQLDNMGELGKTFGLDVDQLLEKVYCIPEHKLLPRGDTELDSEYMEKHIQLIRTVAEASRKGYVQYADRLGLKAGGKYAVVDFVAKGNTQKRLAHTLPLSLYGFYYGTYTKTPLDGVNIEYYLHGQNEKLLNEFVPLESFFSSPEPALDHISEDGFPVFQEERRSDSELEDLSVVWNSAASFAQEFYDLFYETEDDEIHALLIEEMYAATEYLGIVFTIYDDWFQTSIKKRSAEGRPV